MKNGRVQNHTRSARRTDRLAAVAPDLAEMIHRYDCRRCLETGVAYGVSTLAICQAVAANGGHHFGVDPCQITEHGRSAMCLLDEFGLADCFTLLEGPSHAELPKLLEDHQDSFDLIFVDGWHTFDCKLLDYVYADKLLRVGGWLVFHDLLLPSVKRTLRFIRTQGKYEIHCHGLEHVSWIRRARYAIAALIKRRPLWYYWPCSFSNLLVLRKASATSPA